MRLSKSIATTGDPLKRAKPFKAKTKFDWPGNASEKRGKTGI
jgi:hypothetical protein